MATSVKTREPMTDLEVVESAIDLCRGHQACAAQVLRLRLELICEHLARKPIGTECGDRDLPVIECALSWFAGVGPVPSPALRHGLDAIRDRLSRRTGSLGSPTAHRSADGPNKRLAGSPQHPGRCVAA
jgi:hypothetical protein